MTDSSTTSNSARPSKRAALLLLALVCVGCRSAARLEAEPALFQSRPIPLTRPSAATVRMCDFQEDEEQRDQSVDSSKKPSPLANATAPALD